LTSSPHKIPQQTVVGLVVAMKDNAAPTSQGLTLRKRFRSLVVLKGENILGSEPAESATPWHGRVKVPLFLREDGAPQGFIVKRDLPYGLLHHMLSMLSFVVHTVLRVDKDRQS
jgi:hypothetical protein